MRKKKKVIDTQLDYRREKMTEFNREVQIGFRNTAMAALEMFTLLTSRLPGQSTGGAAVHFAAFSWHLKHLQVRKSGKIWKSRHSTKGAGIRIAGLLIITVVLVNYFTHAGWFNWLGWPSSSSTASYMSSGIDGSMTGHGDGFAPCHDLEIIPVWQMKFPKVATTV